MVPNTDGVTLQEFPIKAVQAYGEVEFSRLDRKLAMFKALPEEDRDLVPTFEERISAIAECIEANAELLDRMAQSARTIRSPKTKKPAPETDLDESDKQILSREVRRGFVLLARDWSTEGALVRETCYNPIIEAIETAYQDASRASSSLKRDQFRVLVPGAAAGRLPWELVKRGFVVEGCEASFTALLVGNYVLNNTSTQNRPSIYPFAHETSHVRSRVHATRPVEVPDVDPKDIPSIDFAMRAGQFVQAYEGQDNSWDAVASCMAFNLGHDVIDHVRRVAQILKPGGVWAFVGPTPCLDSIQEDKIQLSVAEFMSVVAKSGFKIMTLKTLRCLHSSDPESMRTVHIECPFVVAVKVRPSS